MDHSLRSFVSEIPQGIEGFGKITTQERRPAARGGVWIWALAKRGHPVVLQWISIPLPGGSPEVEIRETPFGAFKLRLRRPYIQ